MDKILLTQINFEDLLQSIGDVIDKRLEKALSNQEKPSTQKFLTRKEVAKLLKITVVTLNDWTKLGWLQPYKVGRRVLYKEKEVYASIENLSSLKYKKGGNYGL